MLLAPITLFVYNRPSHTLQSLQALAKNELALQSHLLIFADAAKREEDVKNVAEVRKLIRQKLPFKSVEIIETISNKGLMNSIIDGVTMVINQYGKIIVLEDDLITSQGFLTYMNEALTCYEDEKKVMHISGYMFPIHKKLPETVFYQSTSCWSWATWKDRWAYFNPNAQELYDKLLSSGKMYRFDLDGSNQFISQLEMNITGKRHTWSIKWEASVHLQGGLCLHPHMSMVRNCGHEGSGTSFDSSGLLAIQPLQSYVHVTKIPVVENQDLRERMKLYYALDGKITTTRMMYY